VTRGPGPSLCLSLSWEPTVTTALSACPEVDDRSFVSAVNTPSLDYGWIPANHLKKGEHLKTPDGTVAVADGGATPKVRDGWMWDLTVPGNNDHDFYVAVAATAVLVHNCSDFAPGKAAEHYNKHVLGVLQDGSPKPGGADMPEFLDQNDYVQGARDLLDGPAGNGVLETVRGNSDIVKFDTNTGAFGVRTAGGVIRTFFRPDEGVTYFNNQ
jgi:hypothetical protein